MADILKAKLDTVGKRCLKWTFWIIFFLSFLFPLSKLIFVLLYFSLFFFFTFFFICASWAQTHAERKWKIGFLVSTWHTFLLILGGTFGGAIGYLFWEIVKPYFLAFKTWIFPSSFKF